MATSARTIPTPPPAAPPARVGGGSATRARGWPAASSGRVRLPRRALALRVAQHQLAVRHHRYLRISQGQLLLFPVVVDREAGAAPVPALELAGPGGPGDRGLGVFEPGSRGVVPQRAEPRREGHEEGLAPGVEREVRARHHRGARLQGRQAGDDGEARDRGPGCASSCSPRTATEISADGEDVAMFAVEVQDAQGRTVPVTDNEVGFPPDRAGQDRSASAMATRPATNPTRAASRKAFCGFCMALAAIDKGGRQHHRGSDLARPYAGHYHHRHRGREASSAGGGLGARRPGRARRHGSLEARSGGRGCGRLGRRCRRVHLPAGRRRPHRERRRRQRPMGLGRRRSAGSGQRGQGRWRPIFFPGRELYVLRNAQGRHDRTRAHRRAPSGEAAFQPNRQDRGRPSARRPTGPIPRGRSSSVSDDPSEPRPPSPCTGRNDSVAWRTLQRAAAGLSPRSAKPAS